jgi:alanyl-tRNA synthetase
MAAWIDNRKEQQAPVVALGMGKANGKVTVMLAASNQSVKRHAIHAGKLARELLGAFGGRGGGKPSFAQGGVPDDTRPEDLFHKLETLLKEETKGG